VLADDVRVDTVFMNARDAFRRAGAWQGSSWRFRLYLAMVTSVFLVGAVAFVVGHHILGVALICVFAANGIFVLPALGGFNWLSQRSTLRSCDGQEEATFRSWRCGREAFRGTSVCWAQGTSGPVLGGDRSRGVKR